MSQHHAIKSPLAQIAPSHILKSPQAIDIDPGKRVAQSNHDREILQSVEDKIIAKFKKKMLHLSKKFDQEVTNKRTISELGHKGPVNESFLSNHSKHGNLLTQTNNLCRQRIEQS